MPSNKDSTRRVITVFSTREWHRMMKRPATCESGYLLLFLLVLMLAWGFLIGVLL